MLRSIIAIIIAVIAGLMLAKVIENAGLRAFPATAVEAAPSASAPISPWRAMSLGYKLSAIAGWSLGAFSASLIAVLIGRRWRPVGYLAGAAIGLQALMALISVSAMALFPLAALVCVAGAAYAATRIVQTSDAPLVQEEGLFK